MDSNYNYDQYAQKAYSANVFKVDESEFIIEKRYKPTQQLGSGAYGIVIGCEDTKATIPEQKMVAIKKIERTFEHRFYATTIIKNQRQNKQFQIKQINQKKIEQYNYIVKEPFESQKSQEIQNMKIQSISLQYSYQNPERIFMIYIVQQSYQIQI